MERDPSIHIKRSRLKEIFEAEGLDTSKINKVMERALKYSIRNRVIVTGKSKTRKKTEKVSSIDDKVVAKFHRIYDAILKEKGIKTLSIKKSDKKYLTLKEIAGQAKDFCDMFNLQYDEGFKKYVEIGVFLLDRKFSLYRFKGYGDKIVTYYQNLDIIDKDENKEATYEFYQFWKAGLWEYAGEVIDIKDANKYVNFVYGRKDADANNADYIDWINAQFEKWSFLNVVPELTQFHGDNAAYNYQIYMANKNKKYDSKEEADYFKKVSNKKISNKKNK